MNVKHIRLTAVIMMLMLVLAACSAGTGEEFEAAGEAETDIEATGSESASDLLPTPATGAKVLPTRIGTSTLMPDILFVTPSTLLDADDLETIVADMALPSVQVGLSLYGDTGLTGVYDLTADMAQVTAVFNQLPQTTNQSVTLAEALAAGMALPGWRAGSQPRLVFLISETSAPPDADMAALTATAVGQTMQITPLLLGAAADENDPRWAQLAAATNGHAVMLVQPPDTLPTVIVDVVAEVLDEVLVETEP